MIDKLIFSKIDTSVDHGLCLALFVQAADDKVEENEPHYLVPPSKEDEIYMFLSKQRIKIIPRKAIT